MAYREREGHPDVPRGHVLNGKPEEVARLRRAFHGVTIVNVGSVDFAPYITLLLSQIDGCRLVDHLVVITDADPDVGPDPADEERNRDDEPREAVVDTSGLEDPTCTDEEPRDDESDKSEIVNRRARLLAHADSLGARGLLYVAEAPHTLEADLLTPIGNAEILREAYLRQHTRSKRHWTAIMADPSPATAFYRRLCKSKKFIGKGEFAHDIATAIQEGRQFTAPDYLRAAILAVLGKNPEAENVRPVRN
ncbi:hypothetical protein ACFZBU_38630 [Embleya sp. NPDC008237]|uniref:hypothetical protein n=1 Tax=Embleya sp. NPDC008237 TaxID=3363978 RepID=UPI0036EC907C